MWRSILSLQFVLLVLANVSLPETAHAETISIDPRATYLRTNSDSPHVPMAIDLASRQIQPGDVISLEEVGDFKRGTNFQDNSQDMIGVFSSTSTIDPQTEAHRVPNAIDAGEDFLSSSTHYGGLQTDISEDFLISRLNVRRSVTLVVPANARFLFVSPNDTLFYDNTDPDNDYKLRITRLSSLCGRITLEDIVNKAQTLRFQFRPTDNSAPFERTVTLDENGDYCIVPVPLQTYTLWIKGAKWLAATTPVDTSNGNISGVDLTLRAGDANNDNSADVLDLALLIQAFDKCGGDTGFDMGADFNCDNCANVLDLDLLLRNFDSQGED